MSEEENGKAIPKSISLYPHEWEQWEAIGQENGGRSGAARHLLEVADALAYIDKVLMKINTTLVAEIEGKITPREAIDRVKVLALMHSPDVRVYALSEDE